MHTTECARLAPEASRASGVIRRAAELFIDNVD